MIERVLKERRGFDFNLMKNQRIRHLNHVLELTLIGPSREGKRCFTSNRFLEHHRRAHRTKSLPCFRKQISHCECAEVRLGVMTSAPAAAGFWTSDCQIFSSARSLLFSGIFIVQLISILPYGVH